MRPSYSNANVPQEEEAWRIVEAKRDYMLNKVLEGKPEEAGLIGEFYGFPNGDVFYEEKSAVTIPELWYTYDDKHPSVLFLSVAENEKEFWSYTEDKDFEDDYFFKKQSLVRPAKLVKDILFVTESNFE